MLAPSTWTGAHGFLWSSAYRMKFRRASRHNRQNYALNQILCTQHRGSKRSKKCKTWTRHDNHPESLLLSVSSHSHSLSVHEIAEHEFEGGWWRCNSLQSALLAASGKAP